MGNAISMDVRMAALIKRISVSPFVLPRGEFEVSDELARETLAHAVELGYLVMTTDPMNGRVQYDETTDGWVFANFFDYGEVVLLGDDTLPERVRTFRLFVWHNLLSGGVTDMNEFGVGSPWGADLQIAHLLACGVVTGERIPRLAMWEHFRGDVTLWTDSIPPEAGTKETHGLIGYPSCSCGKLRDIPIRRQMSNDEVSDMLDAFAFMV